MNWQSYIKGFKSYLQLERSLSANSIESYLRDTEKLAQFIAYKELNIAPEAVKHELLEEFLGWLYELGMVARSQARVLSGIKAFYKYLLIENVINNDPTELLDGPRIGQKLPEFLWEYCQLQIWNNFLFPPASGTFLHNDFLNYYSLKKGKVCFYHKKKTGNCKKECEEKW